MPNFYDINEYKQSLEDGQYWKPMKETGNIEFGIIKIIPKVIDAQKPHLKDEIYHITSGKGKITIKNQTYEVGPNMIFFVPRNTNHHFHDIIETIEGVYFLN